MLSTFSKLLPANVNVSISTPDFFKFSGQQQQPGAPTTNGTRTSEAGERDLIARPASKTTREESQTSMNVENESADGKPKKKRKDTSATETFIFVRPPPSKTNHPLNLQVQLVAASGRERSKRSGSTSTTASGRTGEGLEIPKQSNASRETLEDSAQRSGTSLRRTASIQSTRSDTESTFSSSSTYSTNASGASSNRRMIPLYNLHAHNVMTNVISDAGTDAKIAKFFKRGLEIMGLVILEPVEVWGAYTWNDREDTLGNGLGGVTIIGKGPDGLSSQVSRTLSNLQRTIIPAPGGDGSRISTHSNNVQPPDLPTVLEIPSSPTTPKPVEKENKKLSFGNFFKKKKDPPAPLALGKESNTSAPPASAKSTTFSLAPSTAGVETPISSKRKSMTPSVIVSSPGPNQLSTPTTASIPISGGPEVALQPQILGLQAVLQSPTMPPRGRPNTYVWVVRKWIKGSPEGLLGAVMDGFKEATNVMTNLTAGTGSGFAPSSSAAGTNGGTVPGGMEVEVRFEWKRSSKTKMGPPGSRDRRNRNTTGSTIGGSTIGEDGERSRRQSTSERPGTGASVSPRFSVNLDVEQTSSPKSKRLSLQNVGRKPHALEKENLSTEHLNPAKYSRASSPNPPASVTTQGTTEENARGDDGEDSDSDPEDSERPWNCYLHIRAVEARGSAGGSISNSRTQSRDELDSHDHDSHDSKEKALDIKLRVACLAPAPHHPKVVAQVKAPYPLPDIIFNSAYGARLKERADGSKINLDDEDEDEKDKALKLTAEEIKDVVSCTALWLIVREGYGGLSKKRKGDGWRLRG